MTSIFGVSVKIHIDTFGFGPLFKAVTRLPDRVSICSLNLSLPNAKPLSTASLILPISSEAR